MHRDAPKPHLFMAFTGKRKRMFIEKECRNFYRPNPIVNADDLCFGVKRRGLEKIGGVKVIQYLDRTVHFFHPFAPKAIECTLSVFQSSPGKFRELHISDALIAE